VRDRGFTGASRAARAGRGAILAAAGLLATACATAPTAAVPGPGPDPFAVHDATDAPRVGAAAPGSGTAGPGSDAYPFGTGEGHMQVAGREIFTGDADGAAYLYSSDHRLGLIAGQPGRGARTLSYSGRDWYVVCPSGGGARCVVRVATAAVEGRPIQDAVRFLVDPAGAEPVRVCLGPDGTSDGTVRLVNARLDFQADSDGCLRTEAAETVMRALGAGADFQFRYTDATGADVRGWHTAYGLPQALALARWLGGRVARA
jgi:hypothetical protein